MPSLKAIVTADDLQEFANGELRPQIGSEGLALVQYTSGSTGDPKGVINVSLKRFAQLLLALAEQPIHGLEGGIGRDCVHRLAWLSEPPHPTRAPFPKALRPPAVSASTPRSRPGRPYRAWHPIACATRSSLRQAAEISSKNSAFGQNTRGASLPKPQASHARHLFTLRQRVQTLSASLSASQYRGKARSGSTSKCSRSLAIRLR